MNRADRSLLCDVADAYYHIRQRFLQYSRRGDTERADEAFSEMQEIERSIQIREVTPGWRQTVAARLRREAERR